jgi:Domain of unknown function (DUF4082)
MAGPLAHAPEWTPGEADLNNGNGISLGVRFVVTEALSLGGVTFYAPATNSGTYSYALYTTTSDDDPNGSGTGTLIDDGTIASGSITPGAWNDLDLPLEATTGVVYTARVHTSSGRFVRTTGAFTSAAISGNGVTLLQVGTDPNPPGLGSMVNGVFLDNAVGYPNTRFNDADYGIDVWLADDAEDITISGAISADARVVSGAATLEVTAAGIIVADERVLAAVLALPVSITGAISAPERVVSGRITVPVTEAPPSWEPLRQMFRTARQQEGNVVRATACPRCGTPLEKARGVLHCLFDGWIG